MSNVRLAFWFSKHLNPGIVKYEVVKKQYKDKPLEFVFILLIEKAELIQKENTRLKKQLSKNHHIECSCSFCKPVDEKVLKEFQFTSCDDCKNKIDNNLEHTINGVLYE